MKKNNRGFIVYTVGGATLLIFMFAAKQFYDLRCCFEDLMVKHIILEKKYQPVEYAFSGNPKLLDCFKHPRKLEFLKRGGEYIPDYKRPRTLNDKVGYILDNYFDKSPITEVIGTKYLAKKYITDKIGHEHVAKLYGVYDKPEDIDWAALPKSFVLKAVRGHFGREVIIVRDKDRADRADIIQKLNKYCSTPWMKNIHKNRIIAEEFLEPAGPDLVDYKFFCSYGKPLISYCLVKDKYGISDVSLKTASFYEIPEWKRIDLILDGDKPNNVPKPKHFDKMLELAKKLSADFPLVRVDLYEVDDRVLVGEITEDASGAKSIFDKVEWDFRFGDLIKDVPTLEEIEKLIERDKEIAKKYLEE